MFRIEPPPSRGDIHFRLLGIPVRVHPLFWLVTLLLGMRRQDPVGLIIWVAAVFVSILVHEMGHALVARAFGWRPWVTLYSFGGLASYQPTHHDMRSQVLISAAGPGAGFLFIGLVMAIVQAAGHNVAIEPRGILPYWVTFDPFAARNLNLMIDDLLWVNIFWGLINLMPIFPLDGGQITQEIMIHYNPVDGLRQSLWLSVFAAAAVAVAGVAKFQDFFIALFFGYLAYESYSLLQRLSGRGFGGRGPW